MKKVIAVLLMVILLASVFACAGQGNTVTPSSPPPQTSATGSSPPPTAHEVTEGFEILQIDFGLDVANYDAFSRPAYKFIYILPGFTPFSQGMVNMYKLLGTKLNFTMDALDANSDNDQFMNNLETCAGQNFDGFIIEGDSTTMDRVLEIAAEYNITFIPGLSPFIDPSTGIYHMPSVIDDSYARGLACMNYLLDNYESITGSGLAWSEIGMITIEWSVISEFNKRVAGALDAYKARHPDLVATNYFYLDTAPEPNFVTAEAGYNVTAAIVASNPQIKGWIVHGVMEDFSDGASRALEDLGKGSVSLVTSDSINILSGRWDAGYRGCWVGGVDSPQIQFADSQIQGLIQLVEGKATPETLWAEFRQPGQNYTVRFLPFSMVTFDNYKAYEAAKERYIATNYP